MKNEDFYKYGKMFKAVAKRADGGAVEEAADSNYEVTMIDSGKTVNGPESKFVKTFGKDQWDEIKQGYSPHIVAVKTNEVEEDAPSITQAAALILSPEEQAAQNELIHDLHNTQDDLHSHSRTLQIDMSKAPATPQRTATQQIVKAMSDIDDAIDQALDQNSIRFDNYDESIKESVNEGENLSPYDVENLQKLNGSPMSVVIKDVHTGKRKVVPDVTYVYTKSTGMIGQPISIKYNNKIYKIDLPNGDEFDINHKNKIHLDIFVDSHYNDDTPADRFAKAAGFYFRPTYEDAHDNFRKQIKAPVKGLVERLSKTAPNAGSVKMLKLLAKALEKLQNTYNDPYKNPAELEQMILKMINAKLPKDVVQKTDDIHLIKMGNSLAMAAAKNLNDNSRYGDDIESLEYKIRDTADLLDVGVILYSGNLRKAAKTMLSLGENNWDSYVDKRVSNYFLKIAGE